MTYYIGLTGAPGRIARAGKDTAAGYIIEALGHWGAPKNYTRRAFAAPLWASVSALFDVPEAYVQQYKDEHLGKPFTYRDVANGIGDLFREIGPDFYVDQLKAFGEKRGGVIVVTDVRQENEAAFIREHGVLIMIYRPDAQQVTKHHTNNGVRPVDGDLYLPNKGTLKDLRLNCYFLAKELYKRIKGV